MPDGTSIIEAETPSPSVQADSKTLDEVIYRHIDLVYATARRQVSDADAHDIVQAVFILFSRRGRLLNTHVSVVGWLYRTTRFCCQNLRKTEARRKRHEGQAAQMTSEQYTPQTETFGASLDTALTRLPEGERAAILLHYLENKTFADTGQALGISENAARKRANRGLQQLKSYFARHGSSTLPIARLFAVQSAIKAPPALIGLAMTTAHQPAAAIAASTLADSMARLLFWSKMKAVSLFAGILVLLAVGAVIVVQAQQPAPAVQAASAPAPLTPAVVPNRINVSGYAANADLPAELPGVLWKFTSDSPLSNSVVADGHVYFGDETGQVFSLDAKDGSEVWRHKHLKRMSSKPSVDDTQLYFGSASGFTAIRRDTGKLVWDRPIEHGADEATPLSVGNRVFASGYDGNAYALDSSTGGILWKHDLVSDAPPDLKGFPRATALITGAKARPNGSACDGEIFIQCIFDQSRVIALDCATGEMRWEFRAKDWIGPAPTIINEHVLIASQDSYLYCLDRATGAMLWTFKTSNWLASRVAVHDGIVFLPAHRGRVFQVSEQTGEIIHEFQAPETAARASLTDCFPIVTNQACYFATSNGQLHAFDYKENKLMWELSPAPGDSELFTDPATDGHRIFVTSRKSLKEQSEHSIIAIGAKQ